LANEKIYQISVNGFQFDIKESSLESHDAQQVGQNKFHVLRNQISHQVELKSVDRDQKKVTLLVDGYEFEVKIKDELDLLIDEMGFKTSSEESAKDIQAPMPGLVLDVLVSKGMEVEKGDGLLILEAMKMENMIKAQGNGIVKSVLAKKGSAVDKGALLIAME
jgi:biotin carboxyl carrier protein